MPRFVHHIFVCENLRSEDDPRGSCQSKGSPELRKALKAEIKARGLKGRVRANQSGCLDSCEFGPTMVIYPEAVWYGEVTLADIPEIMESHIIGGIPVERLRIKESGYED